MQDVGKPMHRPKSRIYNGMITGVEKHQKIGLLLLDTQLTDINCMDYTHYT